MGDPFKAHLSRRADRPFPNLPSRSAPLDHYLTAPCAGPMRQQAVACGIMVQDRGKGPIVDKRPIFL